MKASQKIVPLVQKAYVALMMDIIGRGLASASLVDEEIREDVKGFPEGFTFSMMVMPNGPKFSAKVTADKTIELLPNYDKKTDLTIKFKHMSLAFLVFSFQESTSRAFANDRMIADGDVSSSIRLVRILDKMEALILPKLIANLAVKRYPKLPITEKLPKALSIYGKVVESFIPETVIQSISQKLGSKSA